MPIVTVPIYSTGMGIYCAFFLQEDDFGYWSTQQPEIQRKCTWVLTKPLAVVILGSFGITERFYCNKASSEQVI